MNQNEYELFQAEDSHVSVTVVTAERVGGPNRTLVYGYDADRNSFHAYLHEGKLYVRTYARGNQVISDASGPALPATILRPNKRVYPQYTDADFARIMRDMDFPLTFTNWSKPRREGPYYGATHLKMVVEPGV